MADDISHAVHKREIEIPPVGITAILTVPENAVAMIIFAHGSGSGRLSPRNNYVAAALREDGVRDAAARPAHARRRTGPRQCF